MSDELVSVRLVSRGGIGSSTMTLLLADLEPRVARLAIGAVHDALQAPERSWVAAGATAPRHELTLAFADRRETFSITGFAPAHPAVLNLLGFVIGLGTEQPTRPGVTRSSS